MGDTNKSLLCFSSINLSDPVINGKKARANITLNKITNEKVSFEIMLHYKDNINPKNLPFIRLAFVMPLLNYGLFSKKFILDFPVSKSDLNLLNDLNLIFSRDIYVNKILRRRANFILPKYFPDENKIKPEDAKPKAEIKPKAVYNDEIIESGLEENSCGVLSSGGKESLLTYGLLKEIGCNVYPLYVNESGGHWRTAISAYRYHKKIEPNTYRVWTNVDRFYDFMLDNLKFIRSDHRKVKADTYPIRLCIFPYYVFLLLPIFADEKIGNLLIGSEFDDIRSKPEYFGINHYYGIYDQHQDYDILMNNWYSKRLQGLNQWSAVRNISGLIVERILVRRYKELAKYQRSCHSCHFEKMEIVPCGICSKCMGVLLFLFANNANPSIMNFKKEHIDSFPKRVLSSNLRLDQDEKNQSFYLMEKDEKVSDFKPVDHVEKIHFNKTTCDFNFIPKRFRKDIFKIIEEYSTGYCKLNDEKWISVDKSILNT